MRRPRPNTWAQPQVAAIHYPGLATHLDHAIAARQFAGMFGSIVTFTLAGGRAAADRFLRAHAEIPFSPRWEIYPPPSRIPKAPAIAA